MNNLPVFPFAHGDACATGKLNVYEKEKTWKTVKESFINCVVAVISSLNSAWLNFLCAKQTAERKCTLNKGYDHTERNCLFLIRLTFDFKRKQAFCATPQIWIRDYLAKSRWRKLSFPLSPTSSLRAWLPAENGTLAVLGLQGIQAWLERLWMKEVTPKKWEGFPLSTYLWTSATLSNVQGPLKDPGPFHSQEKVVLLLFIIQPSF